MTFSIREATIDDVKDILTLSRQLGPVKSSVKDAKQTLTLSKKKETLTQFVAESQGKIVGIISLLYLPTLTYCPKQIAYLSRLVVDRNHRRQGIGTALVRHCVAAARKKCYKVILHSRVKEAIRVYEKLGFQKHSVLLQLDFREK